MWTTRCDGEKQQSFVVDRTALTRPPVFRPDRQWTATFWWIETWLEDRQHYLPDIDFADYQACEGKVLGAAHCGDGFYEVSKKDFFFQNAVDVTELKVFPTGEHAGFAMRGAVSFSPYTSPYLTTVNSLLWERHTWS